MLGTFRESNKFFDKIILTEFKSIKSVYSTTSVLFADKQISWPQLILIQDDYFEKQISQQDRLKSRRLEIMDGALTLMVLFFANLKKIIMSNQIN